MKLWTKYTGNAGSRLTASKAHGYRTLHGCAAWCSAHGTNCKVWQLVSWKWCYLYKPTGNVGPGGSHTYFRKTDEQAIKRKKQLIVDQANAKKTAAKKVVDDKRRKALTKEIAHRSKRLQEGKGLVGRLCPCKNKDAQSSKAGYTTYEIIKTIPDVLPFEEDETVGNLLPSNGGCSNPTKFKLFNVGEALQYARDCNWNWPTLGGVHISTEHKAYFYYKGNSVFKGKNTYKVTGVIPKDPPSEQLVALERGMWVGKSLNNKNINRCHNPMKATSIGDAIFYGRSCYRMPEAASVSIQSGKATFYDASRSRKMSTSIDAWKQIAQAATPYDYLNINGPDELFGNPVAGHPQGYWKHVVRWKRYKGNVGASFKYEKLHPKSKCRKKCALYGSENCRTFQYLSGGRWPGCHMYKPTGNNGPGGSQTYEMMQMPEFKKFSTLYKWGINKPPDATGYTGYGVQSGSMPGYVGAGLFNFRWVSEQQCKENCIEQYRCGYFARDGDWCKTYFGIKTAGASQQCPSSQCWALSGAGTRKVKKTNKVVSWPYPWLHTRKMGELLKERKHCKYRTYRNREFSLILDSNSGGPKHLANVDDATQYARACGYNFPELRYIFVTHWVKKANHWVSGIDFRSLGDHFDPGASTGSFVYLQHSKLVKPYVKLGSTACGQRVGSYNLNYSPVGLRNIEGAIQYARKHFLAPDDADTATQHKQVHHIQIIGKYAYFYRKGSGNHCGINTYKIVDHLFI